MYQKISKFLKLSFISIAIIFVYIQYWNNNKFKNSLYLSELWRKFYTTKKLTYIFKASERNDKESFKNISESDVYFYLGFMKEIVIFVKTKPFQIHKTNQNEVLNLFHFHFYYLYDNNETKLLFCSKIIENNENINKEINQFYWKKQRYFSKVCANKINKLAI